MLCIPEKKMRARKQVYSQGLFNACLELMHMDILLLIMFVCFILCLFHASGGRPSKSVKWPSRP